MPQAGEALPVGYFMPDVVDETKGVNLCTDERTKGTYVVVKTAHGADCFKLFRKVFGLSDGQFKHLRQEAVDAAHGRYKRRASCVLSKFTDLDREEATRNSAPRCGLVQTNDQNKPDRASAAKGGSKKSN